MKTRLRRTQVTKTRRPTVFDRSARDRSRAGGFTLAEVAVTIVIVGIALVLLLQGLGGAKAQAFYTQNLKIADQLARKTLGEVSAGLYAEDAEFGVEGSYADDDRPNFYYEVYFGEENFPSDTGRKDNRQHDSWEAQRQREERQRELEEREDSTSRAGETDEDELREPYQKVLVRVTFPVAGEFENTHTIQEWIPWDQVYGPDEEEQEAAQEATGNEGTDGRGNTGAASGR